MSPAQARRAPGSRVFILHAPVGETRSLLVENRSVGPPFSGGSVGAESLAAGAAGAPAALFISGRRAWVRMRCADKRDEPSSTRDVNPEAKLDAPAAELRHMSGLNAVMTVDPWVVASVAIALPSAILAIRQLLRVPGNREEELDSATRLEAQRVMAIERTRRTRVRWVVFGIVAVALVVGIVAFRAVASRGNHEGARLSSHS